ncbi:ABC transporter permease [Streptomyces brasiliensis]|uniref:Sugar ABC transporter permease n=1 Tax=Streptomyces brasiliensis TaxID=1954 RepID=A0A917PCX6_9ACTN|nr:ABC transporter permease [Streptomyces brasiliensis]GGJ71147.1 sugar ABC transporter permease [Streptomyces brasiliensis]
MTPSQISTSAVSGRRTQLPTSNKPQPHQWARRLAEAGVRRYSGLVVLAVLIVVFGVWTPLFLTHTTLISILNAQTLTAILAIAVLFPLAAGVFDLAAAQNLGSTALLVAYLMTNGHMGVSLAIFCGLSFGLAVGLLNGFLVAVMGFDSFIATLGVSSILLGTTVQLSKGSYVGPVPESFQRLTSSSPLGIPVITYYLAVVVVVAWYVLEHTPLGRRLCATGANREAARLAGVPTGRYIFTTMVVSGVGASIAGILLSSQTVSISADIGPAYLLPAYAAAFLGSTQIKPGRFNIWGTILALAMLGTGVAGLQLVGGGALYIGNYFNGGALIVAVGAAIVLKKRGDRKRRLAQMKAQASAPPPLAENPRSATAAINNQEAE